MMNRPPLILASASPRRAHLMAKLGVAFEIVPPTDVEEILHGDSPQSVAAINAQRKADAVAARHPDRWVIGADTIVVRDGVIYGKPRDRVDARRMLRQLVGRHHEVYTAVCLHQHSERRAESFCEQTRVWMYPLTPDQIDQYLDKVNTLDKAGSYAIQEHSNGIVERIEGSFTNVMGLPMERLASALQRLGFHIPHPA
jgi:septum formation protein